MNDKNCKVYGNSFQHIQKKALRNSSYTKQYQMFLMHQVKILWWPDLTSHNSICNYICFRKRINVKFLSKQINKYIEKIATLKKNQKLKRKLIKQWTSALSQSNDMRKDLLMLLWNDLKRKIVFHPFFKTAQKRGKNLPKRSSTFVEVFFTDAVKL